MHHQAICIFCICSDVVDFYNVRDDQQCKMATAEILTFLIISALHYGCNYKTTRLVCQSYNWFPGLLSHSRLIRRIHMIPEELIRATLEACCSAMSLKKSETYIVDSFPVTSCQNHKSSRRKLFSDRKFHGYCASKKQYFFGLKVHAIINENGLPVEIILTPASEADVRAFKRFELNIPSTSVILGDRAYSHYEDEELIESSTGIKLIPKRKLNAKRKHSACTNYLLSMKRNKIESIFSGFIARFPRTIRAKTEKGFCIKIFFLMIGAIVFRYLQIV